MDAGLIGYIILIVAIRLLFVLGCISQARKKGRDKVLAGVLGFFFGFWAWIGYILSSNKNITKSESLSPSCPRCESDTILRKVVKGIDKGKQFYVCNRYPSCKGRVLAE